MGLQGCLRRCGLESLRKDQEISGVNSDANTPETGLGFGVQGLGSLYLSAASEAQHATMPEFDMNSPASYVFKEGSDSLVEGPL